MPTTLVLPVDWAQPYQLRLSYVTDVMVSKSGSEQRQSIRDIPKREERFRVLGIDEVSSLEVRRAILTQQGEQWVLPYFPHVTILTAAASPGSAVPLTCDTTGREFLAPSGQAILYRPGVTPEVVTVTAVSPTAVTAGTLAGSWPAGTRIYPAQTAKWSVGPSFTQRSPSLLEGATMTFDRDAVPATGVAVATNPIFNTRPNLDVDPSEGHTRLVHRNETETGPYILEYLQAAFPVSQRNVKYTFKTLSEVATYLNFFHSVRGRYRAFWLPTWRRDLTQAVDLTSGSAHLIIRKVNYTTLFFPMELFRHLYLVAPNGTMVHRRVVASTDLGDGTEDLTLDNVAGVNMPVGTGLVSFLLYSRFAADTLELSWLSAGIAETTMATQDLGAEVPTTV